jgi:hypothetical protein
MYKFINAGGREFLKVIMMLVSLVLVAMLMLASRSWAQLPV